MPGCHWRSSAHVTPFVWFCFGEYGNRYRLIQDYLGHRNIRHTVWYTAAMQGVFTASGIEPEDDSVTRFIEIVEIPGMVLKTTLFLRISKMINHLLIDVIVSIILNYIINIKLTISIQNTMVYVLQINKQNHS